MNFEFPAHILPKHTAILGMTGSGKSTTARDLVEQVVGEGSRVCILDTVKSDWWGITSSKSGNAAGLPFTILGGDHGHLALDKGMGKALGEIVGRGELKLSIVDMADFGAGDASHFFVDFAQALMRKMKGVLYLVIEEAHEIAPKERAGFAKENMGVYWAKKLATAGRSKGIRLVVISQRTQSLHNAVLGSCENLIVHRMTAPADQKPVTDWLKANVGDKKLRANIEETISGLPDGRGWLCTASGVRNIQFPRASTFDNTAAPTDDGELKAVATAAVDIEALGKILGKAVDEAQANDPKELKAKVARLEEALRAALKPDRAVPAITTYKEIEAQAWRHGWLRGHGEGWEAALDATRTATGQLGVEIVGAAEANMRDFSLRMKSAFQREAEKPLYYPAPDVPEYRGMEISHYTLRHAVSAEAVEKAMREDRDIEVLENSSQQDHLKPAEAKILNALGQLDWLGAAQPSRELLAFMAGYTHINTKSFANALGALRAAGFIDGMRLTARGRALAIIPAGRPTATDVQHHVSNLLGGATAKVLKPLLDAFPREVERESVMRSAGYTHVNTKSLASAIGRLRTLGFIEVPSPGVLKATSLLFPGAGFP